MAHAYMSRPFSGCWYVVPGRYRPDIKYLPQIDLASSTNILATTSRTVLTQTFINPSKSEKLDEVQYTFPLYDGVSVVGFKCIISDRSLIGVVKEKQQARVDYKEAVSRGETAGLLEQLPEASDVFTTKIGNVPANEKVIVEVTYLGELKHDAETDGSRFTIPTFIAPRYGAMAAGSAAAFHNQAAGDGHIRILVDVAVEEGSLIRGLQSPSHPIAVTMGRTSSMDEEAFDNNHASATLTLGSTELDKDFIIVVLAKGQETPRALLETHSSIPDQRAIMTTLVPKFNIPNIHPEIVFVVDRSGSMENNIATLVTAMRVFLKSLPVGAKFNICSFGSKFDFLFPKSMAYDESSLTEALAHLDSFAANYGGTEMLAPIRKTVEKRLKGMPLEVMVITDGQIWNQTELFDFINKSAREKHARFFSLGIGAGASSALVEGIARAGDGFAQFVAENEKMDKRVVRMLKGALTPHITDYTLEVKYEKHQDAMDDDFEVIESVSDSLKVVMIDPKKNNSPKQKVISLFNTQTKEEPTNPSVGKYDHLPNVNIPKMIQAPHKLPSLYPFNRTTVYLLLSAEACRQTPKAIVLRGTSEHGPLELEIPVQDIGHGTTLHQLAAKKAVHELEEGRGWLTEAKNGDGKLIKEKYEGRWDEIVEREAVRLGVQFQVGGKWCSFVAVDKKSEMSPDRNGDRADFEMQTGESADVTAVRGSQISRGNPHLFGAFSVHSSGGPSTNFSAMSYTPNASGSPFSSTTSGPGSPRQWGKPLAHLFGGQNASTSSSGALFGGGATDTESAQGFGGQCLYRLSFDPTSAATSSQGQPLSQATPLTFGSTRDPTLDPTCHTSIKADSGEPAGAQSMRSQQHVLRKRSAAPGNATSGGMSFLSALSGSAASPPLPPMMRVGSTAAMKRSAAPMVSQDPGALQEYRMGLMTLEQQNKKQSPKKRTDGTGPALPSPSPAHYSFCYSTVQPDSGPSLPSVDMSGEELGCDEAGSAPHDLAKEYGKLSNDDKMHDLIGLQSFQGSWELTQTLLQILNVEKAGVEGVFSKDFKATVGDSNMWEKVMATVAAIAWLEAKVKSEEETWEMVAEKAKGWLQAQTGGKWEGEAAAVKALLGA